MSQISRDILSDITVHMKYAKYIPELNRRESWDDLVTRNKLMHIKKYPELKENIEEVYRLVYEKKILQQKYQVNASKDYMFDINAILALLPHRYLSLIHI